MEIYIQKITKMIEREKEKSKGSKIQGLDHFHN